MIYTIFALYVYRSLIAFRSHLRVCEVPIELELLEPGEWHGYLRIRGAWVNIFGVNEEEARVPCHLWAAPGHADALPAHAPRPFRPKSANRIRIDPSSLHTQQLRTPTPHKLRRPFSGSSATSSAKVSGRPASSRTGCSTAVPESRPLSALGPMSSRGLGSAVPSSRGHGRPPALKPIQDVRPRPKSAPLVLPQPEPTRMRPSSATQVRSRMDLSIVGATP